MYLTGRQPAVIKIEFNIWEPVAHREGPGCVTFLNYIFVKNITWSILNWGFGFKGFEWYRAF